MVTQYREVYMVTQYREGIRVTQYREGIRVTQYREEIRVTQYINTKKRFRVTHKRVNQCYLHREEAEGLPHRGKKQGNRQAKK